MAELSRKPLNFDLASLAGASRSSGWTITELCQSLPSEPPGMPVEEGSWQIARRLMSGYEFADPSIVRAYYDPAVPLERRDMLLKLQAFGFAYVFVGVRAGEVFERTREIGGRRARIWGWNYRTLEGHVEMGQMDWEVWKWLDDGRVQFRVHAVSRAARIPNPFIRLGFHLLRGRERQAFLDSTKQRMRTFTELALADGDSDRMIRDAAAPLTARPSRAADVRTTRRRRTSSEIRGETMPRQFTIFQFPNPPLIVAVLAGAIARTAGGPFSRNAALLSRLALLLWSAEEMAAGVNSFRRLLGTVGGVYALAKLKRPAHQ